MALSSYRLHKTSAITATCETERDHGVLRRRLWHCPRINCTRQARSQQRAKRSVTMAFSPSVVALSSYQLHKTSAITATCETERDHGVLRRRLWHCPRINCTRQARSQQRAKRSVTMASWTWVTAVRACWPLVCTRQARSQQCETERASMASSAVVSCGTRPVFRFAQHHLRRSLTMAFFAVGCGTPSHYWYCDLHKTMRDVSLTIRRFLTMAFFAVGCGTVSIFLLLGTQRALTCVHPLEPMALAMSSLMRWYPC